MTSKILLVCCYFFAQAYSLTLVNDNLNLVLNFASTGLVDLELTLNGASKLKGQIGHQSNVGNPDTSQCENSTACVLSNNGIDLIINSTDGGFTIFWQSLDVNATFQDCIDLKYQSTNWFGGPEKFNADWPVESSKFSNRPYTTHKADNGAEGERYWLNSLGAYVFITDRVPLFLDQNNLQDGGLCLIGELASPYIGRSQVLLEYNLIARVNPREAQIHAVHHYLGRPEEHPNEWIVRNPIWTTWAKYKKDIDDDVVVAFAKDIKDHGFIGQLEIDDYWETCYGSLTFNTDTKFSKINDTVKTLKDLGFTVTLWTHPFVNHDCTDTMTYGEEHGYFVKSDDGNDQTSWWDGDQAHYIDFTKEEARNWFIDRLKLLQTLHGIDSFKFDSGESDYPPPNPVLSGDVELSPNAITSSYIRTCATFGGLIEVRSAWRTQDLPIFLRMLDKDSVWGLNNGLHSLVTSLLQLNINGYNYVLPDMIGGNGYGVQPTAELIVRWTQANTFMPAMQFSYLPWDFPDDKFNTTEIVKKFVSLHEEYADDILQAMNASITDGNPVNPPIWWADPSNPDALKVNDQYLLGENILVAPVIEEGATSRDVYLPRGSWRDGNNGTIYRGRQTLKDYPAPIDVLPYFVKIYFA